MQKQNGMTLIGMLLTVIVFVMVGIVTIRIVPVYLQHYSVIQSIKSLNSTPTSSLSGDPIADIAVMRQSLTKRLDINGLEDFKDDQLQFTQSNESSYTVKLKYQIIKPLVYNISLLFDFNDTEEVKPGSEN